METHPELSGTPRVSLERGFSMIELLVALLVMSIGLLGVAALMATSMRNAQSANFRTQATNLAYEITDGVRANRINAMRYNSAGFSDPAAACVAPARPTGTYPSDTPVHALELQRWFRDLCYQLPDGSGRVQVVARDLGAYAVYDVIVDVCWTDDRSAEDGGEQCAEIMAAASAAECAWTSAGTDARVEEYHRSRSEGRTTVLRVCSAL